MKYYLLFNNMQNIYNSGEWCIYIHTYISKHIFFVNSFFLLFATKQSICKRKIEKKKKTIIFDDRHHQIKNQVLATDLAQFLNLSCCMFSFLINY